MNDEEIITRVFVYIDDVVRDLAIDPHPGPQGELCLSELLTLMVLSPLLKPGVDLKEFCRWMAANWHGLFPALVEYSRLTRLFNQAQEFLVVIMQRLSNVKSFGLVADGTGVPVMHAARGPYAKSFRNARKVKCARVTGGKERNWIENVIGVLKTKLGLEKIRVRKMPAFLARLKAILCAHNLILALDLPI